MSAANDSKEIFSSFPSATKEDWVKIAAKEIGGKNPFDALQWNQGEVIGYPYYDKTSLDNLSRVESFHLSPAQQEFAGSRNWLNMPVINVLEDEKANEQALHQLSFGADGVLFDFGNNSVVSIENLLKNIDWRYCALGFQVAGGSAVTAEKIFKYIAATIPDQESRQGFILTETYPQHPQSLHNVIHSLNKFNGIYLLGITSQIENPVGQISELLTLSVEQINQLLERGVDKKNIFRHLFYSVPVGTDLFIEMAKVKAIRMLWYQLSRAYEVDCSPGELFIHARSTAWKNDALQPHENMIKGTTASLAAILGGCNALTTEPENRDDERMNRIARNVSSVLREESHLDKVADPTAGSYYLESLTHALASQAWNKFKKTVKQ